MGRKSKYDEYVKPYLNTVRNWARNGATVEAMCQELDISIDTFYQYINKYPEFSEAVKKPRAELCNELKNTLYEMTKKHTLKTTKVYMKKDEDGKDIKVTEITEKEIDPNIAAVQILLKNLDQNWSDNPQGYELKRQELELRKMLAEANNFDFSSEG